MNSFSPFFNPYFFRKSYPYNNTFRYNNSTNFDLHNSKNISNNLGKNAYSPSVSQENNEDYFNFFGIRLNSDDLLIIFLLFEDFLHCFYQKNTLF